MRMRTLKPGFFKNDALCAMPPLARLLFEGLWCYCDREGRCEDRPVRIKAEVLPYDDCDVPALLDMLHKAHFIVRYETDGLQLICIPTFRSHQRPHVKEAQSHLPGQVEHLPRKVRARTKAVASTNLGTHEPAQSLWVRTVTVTTPPAAPEVGSAEAGSSSNGHEQQQPDIEATAAFHAKAVRHWKPDANVNPESAKSLAGFRALLKRKPAEKIRHVLTYLYRGKDGDYAPKGDFDWRPNLLSGDSVNRHWDQIETLFNNALSRETEDADVRTR